MLISTCTKYVAFGRIPLSSARWRWVSIRNIEFQPSVYCPKLKQGWESRGRRVSFLISGSGLKAKQTRFPHCLLHYSSCCCRLRGAWRRHYESRRWFGWTVRECRPLKLQLCCFVLSDFDVTKQAEEQSRQRRLTWSFFLGFWTRLENKFKCPPLLSWVLQEKWLCGMFQCLVVDYILQVRQTNCPR